MSKVDFSPYDKLAAILGHPSSFIDLAKEQVSWNGKTITEELVNAVQTCKAESLYECGHAIGSFFADGVTSQKELFLY